MSEITIAETLQKIRELKPSYRSQELKYLGYRMREMDQKKLIREIEKLSFADLKLLFGAGIPGEAHMVALNRYLMLKKERLERDRRLGLV